MSYTSEEEAERKAILKKVKDAVTDLRAFHRKPGEKFTVWVDDNYHFMDEDERYKLGEYDTEEEAIVAAKACIDQFFQKPPSQDATPELLFKAYCTFGEDPFIPGVNFSAWDYARECCEQICSSRKL